MFVEGRKMHRQSPRPRGISVCEDLDPAESDPVGDQTQRNQILRDLIDLRPFEGYKTPRNDFRIRRSWPNFENYFVGELAVHMD
jgi:hypothetical protein